MGLVYENLILKNAIDVGNCRRGIIGESDIRQVRVLAIVDTGAETLVINECIRQELGLEVLGEKQVSLANEASEICNITEPVEIHWKDRFTAINALVLDEMTEVLLGAIPLEGMNVIIDPVNRQLVGAHGDKVIFKV